MESLDLRKPTKLTEAGRVFAFCLCLLGLPWPAAAHVFLKEATPKVGATVTTVPTEVAILFDGEIEPVFSRLQVENKDKAIMDNADSHIDEKNPRLLKATLRPNLPPGEYFVTWNAIAHDSHRTNGRFSFHVKAAKRG